MNREELNTLRQEIEGLHMQAETKADDKLDVLLKLQNAVARMIEHIAGPRQ